MTERHDRDKKKKEEEEEKEEKNENKEQTDDILLEKEEASKTPVVKKKKGMKNSTTSKPKPNKMKPSDLESLDEAKPTVNRDLEAEAKLANELKALRENEEQKGNENINLATNSSVNESTYSCDYSFDMSHYFCTKSSFQAEDIYKYELYVAPEGSKTYLYRHDCYNGKAFLNRIQFFQHRMLMAAKYFLSVRKLRMKMPVTQEQKYTGLNHWLDGQWVPFTEETVIKQLTNSIGVSRTWQQDWMQFYNTGKIGRAHV